MAVRLLLAAPLALVWAGITSRVSWDSLLVGYVLGVAVMLVLPPQVERVDWRKIPGQLAALVVYLALLYWDILRSGLDLARRVLLPKMDLSPGVVAVPVQDPEKRELVAALSADVITLTPGELVVEIDDNATMYVHSLNVDETAKTAESTQVQRLKLLNRILGRKTDE